MGGQQRSLADRRQRYLDGHYEARRQTTWPLFQKNTSEAIQQAYADAARFERRYQHTLQTVPISRCPLTGERLALRFDPLGYDGLWWRRDRVPSWSTVVGATETCGLILGAVDLHGRVLDDAESREELYLGPAVPFIHTWAMEHDDTRVVISRFTMPRGDTVYFVVYYNPDPERLEGIPWFPRFDVSFTHESTIHSEVWDFDLQSWIDRDRLCWIDPDDDGFTVRATGTCPYLDCTGTREPQEFDARWNRLCHERAIAEGIVEPYR